MKRGNETDDHRSMKRTIANLFRGCGWITKFEERGADLVAFYPGHPFIWAIECERSSRGVLRNALRNIRHGAHVLLLVCRTANLIPTVRRKLKGISNESPCRIEVVCISDLTVEYLRRILARGLGGQLT